jgi:hypothetical protein
MEKGPSPGGVDSGPSLVRCATEGGWLTVSALIIGREPR